MPKKGWEYIKGGAGEASTMDADRLAFRQWKIVPRVLTPTTPRDLSTTLFGEKYGKPNQAIYNHLP
jgi:isopentenyl diphosphate isomerase/L-lactate dehydrogenase-like FMN-dependent dehydrogenase